MRRATTDDVALQIELAEPECAELAELLGALPWHRRPGARRLGSVVLTLAMASTTLVVQAEAHVALAAAPQRQLLAPAQQVALASPAPPLPYFPAASRRLPCEGELEAGAMAADAPVAPATPPHRHVQLGDVRVGRTAHELYLERGARLEARGRFAQALVAYTWATKLGPKDPEGHVGRAMCLLELKRIPEARVAVVRALRVARDHGEAMVLRGLVAQLGGDVDRARAEYAAYLEAHPDGSWAGELTRVLEELGPPPAALSRR